MSEEDKSESHAARGVEPDEALPDTVVVEASWRAPSLDELLARPVPVVALGPGKHRLVQATTFSARHLEISGAGMERTRLLLHGENLKLEQGSHLALRDLCLESRSPQQLATLLWVFDSELVLERCRITAPWWRRGYSSAVASRGQSVVTMTDCTIQRYTFNGIDIGGGVGRVEGCAARGGLVGADVSRDATATLIGCRFEGCRLHGIRVFGNARATIDRCVCVENRMCGISVETAATAPRASYRDAVEPVVLVQNCELACNQDHGIYANVSSALIRDNRCHHNRLYGILTRGRDGDPRSNRIVERNVCENNGAGAAADQGDS